LASETLRFVLATTKRASLERRRRAKRVTKEGLLMQHRSDERSDVLTESHRCSCSIVTSLPRRATRSSQRKSCSCSTVALLLTSLLASLSPPPQSSSFARLTPLSPALFTPEAAPPVRTRVRGGAVLPPTRNLTEALIGVLPERTTACLSVPGVVVSVQVLAVDNGETARAARLLIALM
jgi:hypothetical protein